MDQQAQQKYILTSEIRLLEKRKNDLLAEIERVQASHGQGFAQGNKQIKDLEIRRIQLTDQVNDLRETRETLTRAYQEAKEELSAYRETQLKDVREQLRYAQDAAITLTREAQREKNEADNLLVDLQRREWEIKLREDSLDVHERELIIKRRDAEIETAKANALRVEASQELNTLKDAIEQAKHDLVRLTETRDTLAKTIQKDTRAHETIKQQLAARERAIETQETALLTKHALLDAKAKDIENQTRLLNDRRATLERAIAEFAAKGVVI